MEMATIQPKGQKVRQAVKWISEKCREDEGNEFGVLIEEASLRFNLSPKEEIFLRAFYEEDWKKRCVEKVKATKFQTNKSKRGA